MLTFFDRHHCMINSNLRLKGDRPCQLLRSIFFVSRQLCLWRRPLRMHGVPLDVQLPLRRLPEPKQEQH
jgi:hypothetical protein